MTEILSIVALNLILYFKTLRLSLIVDDVQQYNYIRQSPKPKTCVQFLAHLKNRLYGGATFYRKEWSKLYINNFCDKNMHIDHAFTLVLHALACVLIYLALGANQISFWAAVLYSCNPVNNQTSIWLNGRRYLINIILVLCMLMLGAWGVLLYPLTAMFQVTAFFSPILLTNISPWFLLLIPAIILLGYYDMDLKLVAWRGIKNKLSGRLKIIHDKDRREFTLDRLIIITKHYGHYFFKMPFPGWCGMIYQKMYYWGLTEEGNKNAYSFNGEFFKGILAFILTVILFLIVPNEYKPWVAFMFMATLQWCAIIPVVQEFADRYASLPNVFMMFFVSLLAHTYFPVQASLILIAFAAYYAAGIPIITKMYQSIPDYWDYQNYFNPNVPSPRKYQIDHYLRNNDPMKAWGLIRDGLDYNGNDFTLLKQAAVCQAHFGNHQQAKTLAERALDNCYIYQKEQEEPRIRDFINKLPISRQQKRAAQREQEKNDRSISKSQKS